MLSVTVKKVVGVLSKYSYEIFLLHHVLISVSLSPYEQNCQYGVGQYLLWAVKVIIVVGIASWMIDSRWKKRK